MDSSCMSDDDQALAGGIQKKPSVAARHSRPVRLVEQLLVRELVTTERLARALEVSSRRLEEYRLGLTRMSLQTQGRLAELVISAVPELAREGRRLRLQCKAEEAFRARETQTHMIAPPTRFR